MADINKVWLSGVAVSQPLLTSTPPKTPFAFFILKVQERFLDRKGAASFKSNFVRIESLGKASEVMMDRVKEGSRYHVEGYLRVDRPNGGAEEVKVRTFAIYKDESNEADAHRDGIQHALKIVEESRDRGAAIERLKELLKPA